MPITRFKNLVYTSLLPAFSPSPQLSEPVVYGHALSHPGKLHALLRHFHVMGSVIVFSDHEKTSLITSSSAFPGHSAFPEIYFRLASLTKTACSLCIMRCVDEKLFSLDTPVNDLLVVPHKRLRDITVSHLLSHMSGIQDTDFSLSCLRSSRPYTDILEDSQTYFAPPGMSFRYCNFAFGLLGSVLESVTGYCIQNVFDHYLFTPLKLRATLDPTLLNPNDIMSMSRVLPYRKGNDRKMADLEQHPLNRCDPLIHYGTVQGSLFADAASVLTMIKNLGSENASAHIPRVISTSGISAMKNVKSCYGASSPTLSYGLGLLRIDDPSISTGTVYGHQGFAYGSVQGAFIEDSTSRCIIFLNGGCSEAREGRLAIANKAILQFGLKEMSTWS